MPRTAGMLSAVAVIIIGVAGLWLTGCGGGSGKGAIATVPGVQTALAVYGNDTAQMELYKASSTFANGCGSATLLETIPNQSGGFTVTGPYPSNVPTTAVYTGSIQGKTMTLTATNQQTGALIGTFTLTLGESGEFPVGSCP